MSQDRVAFIPWNQAQAGAFKTEYERNNKKKGKSHHKRKWTMVYADSPGTPLADVGFGFGTRIHIAGHGDVGDPDIAADHGTGGADRNYKDVVAMMIAKGLKKRYIGSIVCDICDSALGNPCFAQLMARELWKQGFKVSCVIGYKGSLFATYDTFYADGSDMGGKYSHRMVETPDGDEVKSSKAQQRFFGWM